MIGDSERPMRLPGLAPRAFTDIFELVEANKSKFTFAIKCYMLELYCDKLIDLFGVNRPGYDPTKLKIRVDGKTGLVFVENSVRREATSSEELYKHFETGSGARHVASTKMNAESSRSHLIIGVIIESTNVVTGAITTGKLSLVDLAGSERLEKTGSSRAAPVGFHLRFLGSFTHTLTPASHVANTLVITIRWGFICAR